MDNLVKVRISGTINEIEDYVVECTVSEYNLQEFRKGVDPVLTLRDAKALHKCTYLYRSQVASVEEI